MIPVADLQTWLLRAQWWVCIAGYIGIAVGLTVEALATRYTWPTIKRCVPAIAVAVILAILFFVANRQHFQPPAVGVRKSIAYMPYCDDWAYYTNFLCWFEN